MNEVSPRQEAANVGFPASARLTEWPEARHGLMQAQTYWLSTVRRDGRPHVAPVWAVWLDGALYFSTGADSRKGRNLAREPRCAVSVEAVGLQIVVEGAARQVSDAALLQRMVDTYSSKYDWQMHVKDGGISDDAGNSGPVFEVKPAVVLAFRTGGEDFSATRFVFAPADAGSG